MDPFYLGAYWGSRQESSLQCGQRLANCIARLSEIDEALGSWFRRGASKAAAKTPVDLDAESLGRLLAHPNHRISPAFGDSLRGTSRSNRQGID